MSDRIAVMRDGKIVQEGSPTDLYSQPVDRYVAGFIGQSNFIAGTVVEAGDYVTVKTEGAVLFRAPKSKVAKSLSAGDNAVIAIRPEQISLGTKREVEGKGFDGRVLQVTFLGDQTEYHVQTEEAGRLLVRMGSGHASFVSGDPVIAYWNREAGLALLDE